VSLDEISILKAGPAGLLLGYAQAKNAFTFSLAVRGVSIYTSAPRRRPVGRLPSGQSQGKCAVLLIEMSE
jgi:hypothetical protein